MPTTYCGGRPRAAAPAGGRQAWIGEPTTRDRDPAGRSREIPDATVARLPATCARSPRSPTRGISSVSSEELAAAAGVRSAKLRKDLSHLGSYGVRGVGYDVEHLAYEISRALGLTQDWPVAIVGMGNLGHALAAYSRLRRPAGFRVVALLDGDPRVVGERVAGLPVRPLDELPRGRREGVAIGVIATPAGPPRRSATGWSPPASASVLNFAPAVLAVPDGVVVRKVDLSTELQILAFHEQRKASPRSSRRGGGRRVDEPLVARPVAPRRPPVPARVASPSTRTALRRRSRPPRSRSDHVAEAVVLSTCNRLEVYADVASFHGAVADIADGARRRTGGRLDELSRTSTCTTRTARVAHLFSVACGLDSMAVGEAQILGQVRAALARAQDARPRRAARSNALLQQALRVGKRAHTETGIDRAGALARAGRARPGPRPCSAGSATCGARRRRRRDERAGRDHRGTAPGAGDVIVANRTHERARALAERRRRHGAAAVAELRRGPRPPPTSSSRAPARRPRRHRATTSARRSRPATAARRSTSTWPCRATSTPPSPTSPASTRGRPGASSATTSPTSRLGAARRPRRATSSPPRSPPTSSARRPRRSRRPSPPCAPAPASWSRPSCAGSSSGCPTSTDAERAEVARTVHRVVDKLLHTPTVRVKELAARRPGGELRRGPARAVRPRPARRRAGLRAARRGAVPGADG